MIETSAPVGRPRIDGDALGELRASVRGPVHGPEDVEIVTELAGFDPAGQHAPLAVVGATCVEDVAASVRWAAGRGVPVSVLATGHGGWSHRGGLVVTLRRLDRVVVDPVARTATVGGGVRWSDVVEAAAPHGLAGLNASPTGVGVVGHTLGGGVSPFVRRYGLACDHVRRMQVVTGDGTIRRVGPGEDPGMFWALLGAMDAVGIVTEMEFGLVEIPRFHGGGLVFDAADAAEVLHAWRAWAPTLPRETTTSVGIVRVPDLDRAPAPLRGRTVAHLRVAHLGSPVSGAELLAPMRAVATPLVDTVGERRTRDVVDAVDLGSTVPLPSWRTGAFLGDLDDAAIGALLDVAGPGRDVPLLSVELGHVEGAMGDAAAVRGCVPRGGARFVVGVVAPMSPELREAVPAVGLGVVEALAPWHARAVSSTGAPAAARGGGWADDDHVRLRTVVARCDPAGVLGGGRFGLAPPPLPRQRGLRRPRG